jgi:hypothetical protein
MRKWGGGGIARDSAFNTGVGHLSLNLRPRRSTGCARSPF